MDVSKDPSVRDNQSPKVVLSSQSREAANDILFGSIAGVIGKAVEYPFDTVKVRLQAQPSTGPLTYAGPLDCFRQSIRQDGVLGLYRGISPPLFGAAVETASLFFSYRLAQKALQATVLSDTQELPLSVLVFCGAVSGAFTSVLLTPIELVKCKMQVPFLKPHDALRPPGVLSIMRAVYRHQGVAGFWHGQTGTLIREMGGSAAWFGSYEGAKLLFLRADPRAASVDDLPVWKRMVAGAAAGMSYNFIFYPADTIKSRMQTQDVRAAGGSFWAVGRALWASQGVRGLYRGCGITVGRAAPSSALIFTVYEKLRERFS